MSGRLYALLVGIDDYPAPVPKLSGCRNDIEAAAALLAERVPADRRDVVMLLDEQATRTGLVETFQSHLGQAGPGDVAMFWFSGHGSQELAPPEFWPIEPDHLDETLVCFDSRAEGSFDLADKELAQLVADVAKSGAHVVIVLDCCHSGSGTRALEEGGLAVRRALTDRRERPLSSMLVRPVSTPGPRPQSAGEGSGWLAVDPGRHVLLAACRSDETAKEVDVGGRRRGALSAGIELALREAGAATSYRDLIAAAGSAVRRRVARQTPLLEYTDAEDADRVFLGGAVRPRSSWYALTHEHDSGWVLDAGSVHGIPAGAGQENTLLAVYPADAGLDDLRRPGRAVTSARVVAVQPGRSLVTPDHPTAIDTSRSYRAVVTALPLLRLAVAFTGEEAGVSGLRAVVEPSLLVGESATEQAEVRVEASGGVYVSTDPSSGRRLVTDVPDTDPGTVLARLEHIARWRRVRTLHNPTSALPVGAVRMEVLVRRGGELALVDTPGGELTLAYHEVEGQPQAPRFAVRLTNTTDRVLHCALLALNQSYAVSSGLIIGGVERLEPGQAVVSSGGRLIRAEVPDELWRRGTDRYRDIVKLIAATAEFDPSRLDQGALDVPLDEPQASRGVSQPPVNALDRLLGRVQTRTLSLDAGDEPVPDWFTGELTIVTHRPLDGVPIGAGRTRLPSSDVVVEGHPALRATARLTGETAGTRDAVEPLLPPLLRDDAAVSEPFAMTADRELASETSVLELRDVQNWERVTAAEPLRLHVPVPVAAGEHVLPVAFDGEFYLPLGAVEARSADGVDIRLDLLPAPVATRGLLSSIKIAFRKIVLRPLGFTDPYPILALTRRGPAGTVDYDTGAVADAVAGSDRILLHLHGIVGDTRGMTAACFDGRIAESYGAVLAFDYENLSTRIDETARLLRGRLTAVGLGPGHGKTLDVVAHSLGGLVVRWLVEHLDGAAIISHLVTLGTPNDGSPWPRVQDWAFTALGLGLNALAAGFWPAAVLGGLLEIVEAKDDALDDLAPGSDRLRKLFDAPDPHVRYSVLVGDRSLIVRAEPTGPVARLLARLSPARLLDGAVALAFLSTPNDLAVAVTSAEHLPAGRDPAPVIRTIACDHLSFFSAETGREALRAALAGGARP